MTNIRQHLPAILTTIRKHLSSMEAPETFNANLRTLLPASYGIGRGRIENPQGEHSHPLDIIIYDTTINPAAISAGPTEYDIRQVLAVIVMVQELKSYTLKELLDISASVKRLRYTTPRVWYYAT